MQETEGIVQMTKRAQISFEFILIFTLVFASLIGFIYIINIRLTEISEQHEISLMRHLANNIKSEVILANSVNNNYIRKFHIPATIDGNDYDIDLDKDEISINLIENNRTIRSYFTVLPLPIKGAFIDDVDFENTEHCITKNNYDGIRISRNQASLDTNETHLNSGDRFEVLVSLNCVEDIRSARFTFTYDPAIFTLEEIEPITRDNNRELNPLFSDFVTEVDYSDKNLGKDYDFLPYFDPAVARETYAFIGDDCATGSGNVAKLQFRVNLNAPTIRTEIKFDPDFKDQDLLIIKCKEYEFTKEGLSDSRKNVVLDIN
jgi:hypothetical protein